MKKLTPFLLVVGLLATVGCATSYKAQPLPFKAPSAYGNATTVAGAQIGAHAFSNPVDAQKAFGFDILGAGMLPVQVVFDNQGTHPLEIDGTQTFLEDQLGNLWPILDSQIAYERATKYAEAKQIVKKGAYKGMWGAAAGSIIGAAIGIVAGEGVGASAGKGAAIGGALGATVGGAEAFDSSGDARRSIINDLKEKSLKNKAIEPQSLAHGILFFPAEAGSAKELRLKLVEIDSRQVHILKLGF